MMNKTCALCGVIFHSEDEMCETCRQMISVEEKVSEPIFESNFAQSTNSAPDFQEPFNQSFQPAQNAHPASSGFEANNNFQSNYQPNQAFPTFPPAQVNNAYQYSPAPPRHLPQTVESEYKPSIWNWITELPTLAKVGLIVVIFSICFAVALKGFMQLDVSIKPTDPRLANLEPQKPWFWGWIRSKPTGDEVLDKYESVTFAKGKNPVSQSYVLSGKAQILEKNGSGTVDLAALKKNSEVSSPAPVPPPGGQSKAPPIMKPSDFDITFELSMKNPNKMLTKMMMQPKAGFNQTFKAFPTAGFDGTRGWSFTKTLINGKEDIKEEIYKNNGFLFSRTNDGISMTFLKAMFPKTEMVGEDIVYNRKVYNVKTTDVVGDTANIYFDIETGLAARIVQKDADMYILEHKNFDGILYPSKMVYQINGDWLMMTMEKLQPDVPLDDSIFMRTSYK